jgi:hypothetical protein
MHPPVDRLLMRYEDPADLDPRTRSRFESVRMPDEGFVLATRCDDALLERWATRVVVTTERLLAVRHVLFEWDVSGARHDWIRGIEQVDGGSTLRVEQDVGADEFAFPDADTARAVVEAVEDQRASRAGVTASP